MCICEVCVRSHGESELSARGVCALWGEFQFVPHGEAGELGMMRGETRPQGLSVAGRDGTGEAACVDRVPTVCFCF